jgi:hypothetical protein
MSLLMMRCKAGRVVGCHERMQALLYVLTVNSERTYRYLANLVGKGNYFS